MSNVFNFFREGTFTLQRELALEKIQPSSEKFNIFFFLKLKMVSGVHSSLPHQVHLEASSWVAASKTIDCINDKCLLVLGAGMRMNSVGTSWPEFETKVNIQFLKLICRIFVKSTRFFKQSHFRSSSFIDIINAPPPYYWILVICIEIWYEGVEEKLPWNGVLILG